MAGQHEEHPEVLSGLVDALTRVAQEQEQKIRYLEGLLLLADEIASVVDLRVQAVAGAKSPGAAEESAPRFERIQDP